MSLETANKTPETLNFLNPKPKTLNPKLPKHRSAWLGGRCKNPKTLGCSPFYYQSFIGIAIGGGGGVLESVLRRICANLKL